MPAWQGAGGGVPRRRTITSPDPHSLVSAPGSPACTFPRYNGVGMCSGRHGRSRGGARLEHLVFLLIEFVLWLDRRSLKPLNKAVPNLGDLRARPAAVLAEGD